MLPLAAATEVFSAAAGKSIQQMVDFAGKASPVTAFQFNRALDDLAATMGQILLPVVDSITGFVREFADVLQGLKPAFEPIMTGISAVIGSLWQDDRTTGQRIRPGTRSARLTDSAACRSKL